MILGFFSKGLVIGFAIAAPVGPIGILVIRRTLQFGRLSGLFSGLGAALADMLYGMVAAFGLTFISQFLLAGKLWLQLIGGAFLIYLGIKTFFAPAQENSEKATHRSLLSDFGSTFVLTLTNPMTILSFLAIFAGLGITSAQGNYLYASSLVLGVFLGSALWWLILSEGVTFFRKKIRKEVMLIINRLSGLLIFAFGLFAWWQAIFS